ncbi:DNA replication regulator SLD3-domain-containing protein [Dactylonectria estremocensis]|uniref:DNA replication regulator SLD3-domain-containing protein n=1 Tax=Dactylonectria estremocensis TaxID=1079267 RepID=A0A9P9JDT8_9HYPO|nr:DNA replication regulator SLD3-domain-containing protein [Dactylonectria estremocensis]
MPSPAFAGTDASRPQTRILTPSSDDRLNHNDGPTPAKPCSSEDRKRKRADSVAMDHLLKPSIALKPHPPNLHVPPRVLQPLMVIPREHLPLSSIDFNPSNADLVPGRLFESHIKILDLESRMGSVPVVLLARYELSRNVYALERQDDGLYVVCRLGHWIDLSSLASHATAACYERLRPTARPESRGRTASTAMTTPQLHKDHKVKRAAIEAIQFLVRKRARSQSISTFEDPIKSDENVLSSKPAESQLPSPLLQHAELTDTKAVAKTEVMLPVSVPAGDNKEESNPQHTAEIIFDNIRTHYFEALYKSMGSLAYFAKGPLSRARSAFHLDLESNLDMGDLIEFLKSLVLTTVQVDKKYRETIPDVIVKMKAIVESSDEGRKRKRRAKKMKPGKDGLYPYEEDHIQKWWMANAPELHDEASNIPTQQIKSLASMLRTRETQLQMILILEILALTPMMAPEDAEDSQLPTLPGATESQGGMAPPPKKRNKHNLPVLVDVHADRLTIWQSTVSDEQLLLEDSQVTHQFGDGQLQQKASCEPLKDFCVDVIVPFFSARLPELCDSINRKLGGPIIVKPHKLRSLKRSSSNREQKPGAVTKRPSQQQPRTLQRALSTEQHHRRSVSRGPSNMIALMRSATSTPVSGIKREGSEPAALKGLLKGESDLLNRRSNPLSRSTSMTNLRDNKANKKALVEAELKDAISTLRKPHRQVMSKELVDAAERRTSSGLSAKKVRKPGRSSLGTSIVKATPANNRFKDMFAAKSETPADVPLMSTEEVIPPSSIPSMIPSTGLRGGRRDAFRFSPSPVIDRIDSTPTKGSSFLHRLRNDDPELPPLSPLMQRKALSEIGPVPGTTIKERRKIDFTSLRDEGVLANPVNIEIKQDETLGKSISIYQKLGWDDDLDDLDDLL